jgi:signal transduction histidine kinase
MPVIEFAAALCFILALAFGAALLQTRRRLWQARTAAAILDTVPLRWFCCGTRHEERDESVRAGYREFLAGLTAGDAAELEAEREALVSTRTSFSRIVETRQGGAFMVEGRRTATGETVMWLIDASAALAVREAERQAENLREMLDAIPIPAWRSDTRNSLVDCNRAYAEAVGSTIDLALAENRALVPQAQSHKSRHVVIAGARRLLDITQAPAQNSGMIGFAIDRTDVETAETDLWRQVNAFSEVLDGIRSSVAIYGPDRRLKFFNAAFASMWDIPEGCLAAQPSFEEVLERLREARRLPEVADFREYKAEQLRLFASITEPHQDLMHLPDDRTLLLSITPHPLGGLTFVYEDVTDRLALERSCNTLTQVRRATLDQLFEGIAVYGSDGRLKLHNPAFLAIWGLSEAEIADEPHVGDVLERTRSLLDHGGDWLALKQGIIAKITAHAQASGPVYRTDGSMLQEATVPLPDGDVLVTYLDVTDTARVERALRERNEALETAARLKSEFIANVSHELRTPLNAVIGFADVLAKQYFGELNPRQLDYSRCILQSAERLTKLIDDILDLTAIEAGFLVLDSGPVDVFDMVQAVLNLTRERARIRGLELEVHCPPDIGTITADAKRLKQALLNLISNAIKFTPPGGTIRIDAERREDALLLSVADTGIGVSPSGPAPENSLSSRRQSAAGFGLSLVKSLVELHDGSLTIDSALGQGTRVTCRLPIAEWKLGGRDRAALISETTIRAAA